ncbi:hypothetical protein C8J56DRAFT_1053927 [Mycena floridula]|nr:hypothetical protein C8J56DRAFT_1053927 [Mycena floridula]
MAHLIIRIPQPALHAFLNALEEIHLANDSIGISDQPESITFFSTPSLVYRKDQVKFMGALEMKWGPTMFDLGFKISTTKDQGIRIKITNRSRDVALVSFPKLISFVPPKSWFVVKRGLSVGVYHGWNTIRPFINVYTAQWEQYASFESACERYLQLASLTDLEVYYNRGTLRAILVEEHHHNLNEIDILCRSDHISVISHLLVEDDLERKMSKLDISDDR